MIVNSRNSEVERRWPVIVWFHRGQKCEKDEIRDGSFENVMLFSNPHFILARFMQKQG